MNPKGRGPLGRALCAALTLALAAAPCAAFDSKGHVVIEALAYRSLVEGRDGRPPRPDVLRDLVNDGALAAPICFGYGNEPPGFCVDAPRSDPLLEWPRPRTDQPDAAFRRQFSDAGQCFHFMAPLEDAETPAVPGTSVPRALATSSIVRCRDLLDGLLRQIVIDGGPGTRRSGYGLYELMHAVGDSFSGAHAERSPAGDIEYLRVWKPLEKIARIPTERSARIPAAAYHQWNDLRDKEYVVGERKTADGRTCGRLTAYPYEVPDECLSPEGARAREALVELLVIVRDLRREHLAAGPAADPAPERADSWRAYKEKWLASVYPCRGEECGARQPADLGPGAYALFGLDTAFHSSRRSFDVTARGTLLRYAWELNPFVYAVSADLGYRHFDDGGGSALAGLGVDLLLPLGKRASLGFSPATWRVAFGGERGGTELVTRLLRFDLRVGEKLFLTVNGPMEVNWRNPAVEWSFGVGLGYAPGGGPSAGGPLLRSHSEKVDRTDASWSPPPAPYGRLLGRKASLYVATSATTSDTPPVAVPGRIYGSGSIGGALMWDRDRWEGRFRWAPSASLAIGARRTSGESTYLTGTLGAGLRWYVLGPLGLSLTPVRVEWGPKIHGKSEIDPSPDVHGDPGGEYYLQAGSRLGIAFNAGIVDILVEAPTLAWRSHPFDAGEVVTFGFGIRLN